MGTTGRTGLSDPRSPPTAVAQGEHIGSRPIRADDDREEIEIIYRIEGEPTNITGLNLTVGSTQVSGLDNMEIPAEWQDHVLFDVDVQPYIPAPAIAPQSLVFMRFTNFPAILKDQLSRELSGTTQSVEVYLDNQKPPQIIPGGPVPKTEQLAQVIYRWDEIKIPRKRFPGDLEIAILNHRNQGKFLNYTDPRWLCTDFLAAEVRRTTDLNEYFLWAVQIVFTYDEHEHNTFTHPFDKDTGLPDLDPNLTIESEHYDLADFDGLMKRYGLRGK